MSKETHRFTVGAMQCIVITDGIIDPLLPDRVTSLMSAYPADEIVAAHEQTHPKTFCFNCLYIETADRRILVDVGSGAGAQPDSGHLLDNLLAEGVTPESITDVFISHFHGDHIGGLIDPEGRTVFINAALIVPQKEWDHWMSQETLATLDEGRANLLRAVFTPYTDRLQKVAYDTEIAPGVTIFHAPGHTPGHAGLMLESQGERLLDFVDAAHLLVQLPHPAWSPRFDNDPQQAATTRTDIFNRAATENLLTLAFHLPFPGLAYIKKVGEGFEWQQLND